MNPFEQPRKFLEYPQSFELRIIVDIDQSIPVQAKLGKALTEQGSSRGPVRVLESSKPRFGRLAVQVEVADETQMSQLFQVVNAIPGVRYVI